jgi:hypothetical protein
VRTCGASFRVKVKRSMVKVIQKCRTRTETADTKARVRVCRTGCGRRAVVAIGERQSRTQNRQTCIRVCRRTPNLGRPKTKTNRRNDFDSVCVCVCVCVCACCTRAGAGPSVGLPVRTWNSVVIRSFYRCNNCCTLVPVYNNNNNILMYNEKNGRCRCYNNVQ